MSINQQLNVLHTTWKQSYPGHFVPGGVVNEALYKSSKEVNDPPKKKTGHWFNLCMTK